MNPMKKTFLIMSVLLTSLTTFSAMAQQDPMYSQYMFNMLSVNPAYAGTREMLTMTAMYRKQWIGIEGAPTTMTFSIDAPVKNQRMALGLNVVNDEIGISNNLTMNALYAYRVRFNNSAVLSLGLQAGLGQYSADYTSVRTSNNYGGSDNDRAFGNNINQFFPNAGFGAYYYSNRFFAGIGLPKLIKNNLTGINKPTIDFTSFTNRQNRHMFISSGYTFDLNQDWQAKPSVMVKGVKGAPLEADVNFNTWWRNTVGAGISYRTADAVVAMVEFKPEKKSMLDTRLTIPSHSFLEQMVEATSCSYGMNLMLQKSVHSIRRRTNRDRLTKAISKSIKRINVNRSTDGDQKFVEVVVLFSFY
jgi:type IX secretion system PorP/SprF family membrane protein